jgi:RAT1-interacting protein
VVKLTQVGLTALTNVLMLIDRIVWDIKPDDKNLPINWVELKTSAEINNERDQIKFERKLMKFWIQSFLLGVPKIIVGFRTADGILVRLEEFDTQKIPDMVKSRGRNLWDGNTCINFAANFLECWYPLLLESAVLMSV